MHSLPAAAESRAKDVGGAFRALLRRTARRVEGGTRSPATLAMQKEHVRYLLERVERTTPLALLTPRRIARLLEAEGRGRVRRLSGGTLRKRASTLSQALKLARGGRAPTLPEIPYDYRPRAAYLPDYDDYARLRDRLRADRRLWLAVAVWTGQRRSDVERMRREDFDPAVPSVVVRSTKTRRRGGVRIHAAAELVRELAAHWEQLPAGAKLVPAWPHANTSLRYHCDRLGLPRLSTQSLRHTFFTWYVAANGFTAEMLEVGGWRDLRIPALVYAHALPVRFREQIERTVAMATSLRRPPQKAPDVGNPKVQLRLPRSAGEEVLGSRLHSSSPGVMRTTGTSSLRNAPKRIGPEGVSPPSGPDARPGPRMPGTGLDRKAPPSVSQPTGNLVPRDRVELSTHGFSVRGEPVLAAGVAVGDPHGGPPCQQPPEPRPPAP